MARAVAEVAVGDGGGFLLARVIAGRLRRLSPDAQWRAQLQLSITKALDEDLASGPRLDRGGGEVASAARELLTARAFAEGNGLPAREVWERVATVD